MFLTSSKSFSKLDQNLHQMSPPHFDNPLIHKTFHLIHIIKLHSSSNLALYIGLFLPSTRTDQNCPNFFSERPESR